MIVLGYNAQQTLKTGDDLGGPDLNTWFLKAQNPPQLVEKEDLIDISSKRGI